MGILWFGGTIYTMQQEGQAVEAVYTEGKQIKEIGNYQTLYQKHKEHIEEYVNLQGKTMLPGFVDSHLHLIGHGEKLLRLDLSKMASADEVKEVLSHRVANLSEGEWLIGEGWDENQWEDTTIIHRDELDEITRDHPIMLTRICRHALLANSKAMELAGVENHTEDPSSGIITRDENGVPTGLFHDAAQDLIKNVMPDVSQGYLENVIGVATEDLLSKGLTGGHTEDLFYYGGFDKTLNAFQQVLNHNKDFKAHLLVHHEVFDDLLEAEKGYLDGTDYVEIGAVKIFSDGALGGRTAWLTKEYADDPGNDGVAIHTKEGLEALVKKARDNDMPVAVHAIGDRAMDQVVDALMKFPLTNKKQRDRLIHGVMLSEETLKKMKELPVVIDIQPTFVSSDFPWVIDRLGWERVSSAYPWKTYLKEGIQIAGGSDAPVEMVEPLHGIEAAVRRTSYHDGKTYNETEKLSVYEAVQLYTRGSALAVCQEDTRGVIKEGYDADFTVLEEDIFHVKEDKIHGLTVGMTIVNGRIAYQNQ